MHLVMHFSFLFSRKDFFLTLASRDYVTYYQARRLSGHTSLCSEFACFLKVRTFQKSKVGTLDQERNLFSQEHHVFFEQPASSMLMLVNWFSSWSKYRCNCLDDFPGCQRCQVLLVEEAKDGVLHHNTWSSRTSYEGINPIPLWLDLGQEAWPITRQFEA